MRTSLSPFGTLEFFRICVNLPFIIPKFTVDFLSDKYTMIFSNLNACKVNYVFNGLESRG